MKKSRVSIILILSFLMIFIISVSAILLKNDSVKITLGKIKQIVAGEQVATMSISGKVITKNVEGQHHSTVELYKKESGNKVLVESKTTELDGFFSFTITQIGQYDVIVKKNGYLSSKNENIEILKGDNIVLEDINLAAGDVNNDGEIELNDLIMLNDHFGDITGDDILESVKFMDFNEDGWVNQLDRANVKNSYSKIETAQIIPVQEVINNTFEVQIPEIKDIFLSRNQYYDLEINTTKDVDINNNDRIYFIDKNNNPNGYTEETIDGYELQEGESVIGYGYIERNYDTNKLTLHVSSDYETVNPKIVIPAGYFTRGDVTSELMIIDCGLIVDIESPVVELNGDTNVIDNEQGKTLEIPLKITDKTGLEGLDVDDIEIYAGAVNCSKCNRTLTLVSVDKGEKNVYNYVLKVENIKAPGNISIEIAQNSFTDKAGNIVMNTKLYPTKSEEQITVIVENIASITDNNVTTNYPSIMAAIAECQSGQTIKVLSDCTEQISIRGSDSDVILDLNGHIISNSNNNYTIINEGKITIIDSTGEGEITCKDYSVISNRSEMVISVNVFSKDKVLAENSRTLNIEGGLWETSNYSDCIYNYGSLNMKAGKIHNLYNGSCSGIYNSKLFNMSGGEIVVQGSNCVAISANITYSSSEINITGGTLKAIRGQNQSYYNYNYAIEVNRTSNNGYTSVINIGTKDGIVNIQEPYIQGNFNNRYGTINVYDGLFYNGCPSVNEAEEGYKLYSSYKMVNNYNCCTAYLIPKTAMVFINNGIQTTYYSSIEEAIEACPENSLEPTTITYVDDYSESEEEMCKCEKIDGKIQHTCGIVIPVNKKVIINYNGKRIVSNRGRVFINNGYLKLINSNYAISGYNICEYDDNNEPIIDPNYLIENNGTLEIETCGIDSKRGYGLLNNGTLIMNNCTLNSGNIPLKNNGNVICNSSEISAGSGESIINEGTIQYCSGTIYGTIVNEIDATLILGSLDDGSSVITPIVYGNFDIGAIDNKGIFNYYGGILEKSDNGNYINGEITNIRDGYKFSYGKIMPIESKVELSINSDYKYYITMGEALEEAYKFGAQWQIKLLDNINEEVNLKYMPNNYYGGNLNLNGYTISGDNTTLINNSNGSVYIYGPGKIISTNGTAIENNKCLYITDNSVEIIGKDYAIKNNENASLNINSKNISANIAIYNEGSCYFIQNDEETGNEIINYNSNVIGIEKGIESVKGYVSIFNCNISGNIGIELNSSSNLNLNNEIIINGTETGLINNSNTNIYGDVIIKGKDAVQGNDVVTSSDTKTTTSTENGIETLKVVESVPPTINVGSISKNNVSNYEEVVIDLYIYDNGKPIDSLTIDELTFKLEETEIIPIKKELEYDDERSGGNYIYYKLLLKFNLQDETLNEKALKIDVKENAVYDKNGNYNTATTLSTYMSIYMFEATIGENKYVTLQDAVVAVPDGVETEIKLLKYPVDMSITIPKGKIITLDTQSYSDIEANVEGTFKITSKTSIKKVYGTNTSTIDIEGGYIEEAIVYGTLILNNGRIQRLTLENGEYVNNGTFVMYLIIKEDATYIQNGNDNAYVNGGMELYGIAQIKSKWITDVKLYSSGELIIGEKDGTYNETLSYVSIYKIVGNPKIKIYDGYIRGSVISESTKDLIVDTESGYDKIFENESDNMIKLVQHVE